MATENSGVEWCDGAAQTAREGGERWNDEGMSRKLLEATNVFYSLIITKCINIYI